MARAVINGGSVKIKTSLASVWEKDFKRNKYIYLLSIPVVVYYIVFHYLPIYGLVIAFKEYKPTLGFFGSQWVGLKNFINFFNDFGFTRIVRNTLLINVFDLVFGFPIPIIFALLLNEVKNPALKRITQTTTYLPHFISMVVICGIIVDFCSAKGLVVNLISSLTNMKRFNLLSKASLFRTIYVSTGIWQSFGWNSIIYIAALTGIDLTLYEAARVDGAGRLKQMIKITIPGISPTIIIMLILRLGQMMSVGFEKIILLYNPLTYETADVIMSFVYRRGLLEYDYSFSSAVGMFNSVINFALVITANRLSKVFSETSFW